MSGALFTMIPMVPVFTRSGHFGLTESSRLTAVILQRSQSTEQKRDSEECWEKPFQISFDR